MIVISENDDSMARRSHSELASRQARDARGRFTHLPVGQQVVASEDKVEKKKDDQGCSSSDVEMSIHAPLPSNQNKVQFVSL